MCPGIRKIKIDFAADNVIDKHVFARRPETQCARIFENMTAVLKLLEVALVNICALTLQIRAEISANVRTLIPIETEPLQTFVNRCGGFFGAASPVRVRDAQNDIAAVMPGEGAKRTRISGFI